MTNYTLISIEGNIGSGKSTLLAYLKHHYANNHEVIFLKEPVDEWEQVKDENGKNILEKFYENQEKYSFSFQMLAYISRLKILRDMIQENRGKKELLIITERSLYTDKMVFAKMLYESNKMECVEYQIYLKWFDTFVQEFSVHKIIYMKTYPEICHFRIFSRSRDGEDNISLEYLDNCNNYHDAMLDTSSEECVCHDQLILDGNKDIYQDQDQMKKWIEQIHSFLYNEPECDEYFILSL
jgi:deoxyadenosine/deoxycytidine kinase